MAMAMAMPLESACGCTRVKVDMEEEVATAMAMAMAEMDSATSAKDVLEATPPRRLRSLSAPCGAFDAEHTEEDMEQERDATEASLYERRMELEMHVSELQKRLAMERAVRRALETAAMATKTTMVAVPSVIPTETTSASSSSSSSSSMIVASTAMEDDASTAMASPAWSIALSAHSQHHDLTTLQADELIHEIRSLEEEVVDLEQQVLSLYRRFFDSWCMSSNPAAYKGVLHHFAKQRNAASRCECGQQQQHRQQQQQQQRHKTMMMAMVVQSEGGNHKSAATAKKKQYECQMSSMSSTKSQISRISSSLVNRSPISSKQSSSLMMEQPRSHVQSLDYTAMKLHTKHHADKAFLKSARNVKNQLSSINDGGGGSAAASSSSSKTLRDHLRHSPNRLSEELIRCMVGIYCKLAEPPLPGLMPESPPWSSSTCTSSSTTSISSSIHGTMFSGDVGWSPGCCRTAPEGWELDSPLRDPYQVKGGGSAAGQGAYGRMVEVPWISVDKERLSNVSSMLRDFRSMVEQLEKLDPSQLKHEEKLAFWINIYNALLMHAYLAYGIPRNNLKRMTLLQRAAYKVGGYSINAHTIEHFILRCRSHRPTQWLQTLLLPGSKFKSNDEKRTYAIANPEPLVCFALCCGGQSDPAVRVYTARNVRRELEAARKEYLQASIGFQNDRKVLMPKILEWYTREASISSNNLVEWVSQYLDERDKDSMMKCLRSRPHKSSSHCIEWMSYNFNFRYIFDRDLVIRSAAGLHHSYA